MLYDFLVIILNFWLSINQIFDSSLETQRKIAAFLSLVFLLKTLFFLKMFGEFAKIITTLVAIVQGIISFLIVMVVAFLVFSTSLWLIGQN